MPVKQIYNVSALRKMCILPFVFSAIPLADPKIQPEVYFFDVVGQANTMFHLFEKQFSDHLIPLVRWVFIAGVQQCFCIRPGSLGGVKRCASL